MNDPAVPARRRGRGRRALLMIAAAAVVATFALLVHEARTSALQARYLSEFAGTLRFRLEPGPAPAPRFPGNGPADARLGYSRLGAYLEQLTLRDYRVTAQARLSPNLLRVADRGLFMPYREKAAAGLSLFDCRADPVYAARHPLRRYARFDDVPRVLVDTLLFIENRELLEPPATRNPAIDWGRLALAVGDQVIHLFDPDRQTPGGSTLATQIEKYRHSPGGRTASGDDKLRQIASASLRAYLDGPDTREVRRRIGVDYLNTVPLSARPGIGEVNGIGDGLWAWYGRDFAEINRLLADADALPAATLTPVAMAFKQALSLMIAQRRPSDFLPGRIDAINVAADAHLRLLAEAGVIPPGLRDAALPLTLDIGDVPADAPASFVQLKASSTLRTHLSNLLGVPRLYELDRVDLDVDSTIDRQLQDRVSQALRELRDEPAARRRGLYGERLLRSGDDPGKLIISFSLFERGDDRNRLRVQTDNVDQPFDINQGARLDLGSTAKLRTLATYLEIIARIHERLAGQAPDALAELRRGDPDALTAWVAERLQREPGIGLEALLDAAMERRYSASPAAQFFTGGGLHTFANFDREDNGRVLTVREAFRRSVNLVFVRLMRDVVSHYIHQRESAVAQLLRDVSAPQRRDYLMRFADREGRQFLSRFHRKYRGRTPDAALDLLLQTASHAPVPLATTLLSIEPELDLATFAERMNRYVRGAQLSERRLRELHAQYRSDRYSLQDRGYLAGVHPLELWLVAFLRTHPDAKLTEVLEASADERQQVYRWLYRTGKPAQDQRIQTLLEIEAFEDIAQDWRRLGYPFDSLTPSYATSIGASGDRPSALAELMGIIVNDGMQRPTVRIERLRFATDTPYETHLQRRGAQSQRVLPAAVATVLRRALVDVVEEGTARRLKGAFLRDDGRPIAVGGKTGTGDHRDEIQTRGGQTVTTRVVSRSATLVFMLDDRYFGTLTTYVPGADAARYTFTSALPSQLLRSLAEDLRPLLDAGDGRRPGACPAPPGN